MKPLDNLIADFKCIGLTNTKNLRTEMETAGNFLLIVKCVGAVEQQKRSIDRTNGAQAQRRFEQRDTWNKIHSFQLWYKQEDRRDATRYMKHG